MTCNRYVWRETFFSSMQSITALAVHRLYGHLKHSPESSVSEHRWRIWLLSTSSPIPTSKMSRHTVRKPWQNHCHEVKNVSHSMKRKKKNKKQNLHWNEEQIKMTQGTTSQSNILSTVRGLWSIVATQIRTLKHTKLYSISDCSSLGVTGWII